jgi:hypothetical protein
MATVTAIAHAVAAKLNATEFPQEFAAEVVFRPIFDLKNLRDLKVSVVPRAVNFARASRQANSRLVQIDIGVQRKLADEADIESLLDLVEAITLCFGIGRRLPDYPEALCVEIENEPVYAPEHIEQYRQFTSVVNLTFEVIK